MKRYFQLSLWLPFLLGGVGVLLSPIWTPAEGLIGIAFWGGLPYIPIAIALFFLISRCRSKTQLYLLTIAAPIANALATTAFYVALAPGPVREISIGELAPFFALVTAGGYGYVAVAWLGYLLYRLVLPNGQRIAL